MEQKFSVKIKDDAHLYIHNDLEGAAFWLKEKIEGRLKKGDRSGIGLEIMACLVMIAFAFEAKINLLGFKLFERWDERQPYLAKFERVAKKLNVQVDYDSPPFSAVKELKTFRDTLAHGKPAEIKGEKNLILTEDELRKRDVLKPDWQDRLNEDFLRRSYEDTEKIWKSFFGKSGLDIIDTITSGSSTIQIIERV